MTSDFKSVTSIRYFIKFWGILISQKMTLSCGESWSIDSLRYRAARTKDLICHLWNRAEKVMKWPWEVHHVEFVVGVHHVEQLHHVLVLQLLQQRDLPDGRRRNSLRLSGRRGRGREVRREDSLRLWQVDTLTICGKKKLFCSYLSNPHPRSTRVSETENLPLLDL